MVHVWYGTSAKPARHNIHTHTHKSKMYANPPPFLPPAAIVERPFVLATTLASLPS